MKIVELTRAFDKSPIAFNIKHIVYIEPTVENINQHTGDAKSYVYSTNKVEVMVVEDYETIMRMLMSL